MLHDELRSGREAAGLSQTQLAALAGIPRNQVARAERGENITIDTLRKIVVHLPIQVLPLIDKVNLSVDAFPEPDKIYFATVNAAQQMALALGAAIEAVAAAEAAVVHAHKSVPLPDVDGEATATAKIDPSLMLRRLEQAAKKLGMFPDRETA